MPKLPTSAFTRTPSSGLLARLTVGPEWAPSVVTTAKRTYGVAAVEVGQRSLAIAWGRLVLAGHGSTGVSVDPSSWSMDMETISYGVLPTQEYTVRITLNDGRTLAGEAALKSTNGRLYHFESRGEWTNLDEFEAARDERS